MGDIYLQQLMPILFRFINSILEKIHKIYHSNNNQAKYLLLNGIMMIQDSILEVMMDMFIIGDQKIVRIKFKWHYYLINLLIQQQYLLMNRKCILVVHLICNVFMKYLFLINHLKKLLKHRKENSHFIKYKLAVKSVGLLL